MGSQGVTVLDDYRGKKPSDIDVLMSQVWPANRIRGDFRAAIRAQAELELRVTYCAFCGASSPELDGPMGRAWFATHTSNGDCTQKVIA